MILLFFFISLINASFPNDLIGKSVNEIHKMERVQERGILHKYPDYGFIHLYLKNDKKYFLLTKNGSVIDAVEIQLKQGESHTAGSALFEVVCQPKHPFVHLIFNLKVAKENDQFNRSKSFKLSKAWIINSQDKLQEVPAAELKTFNCRYQTPGD